MKLGFDYDSLKKIASIVLHYEYEDEETGLYIDCNSVSCVALNSWQIAIGGYNTGYELRLHNFLVCTVNYKEESYKWDWNDEENPLDKDFVLKILEAADFKEE